MPPTMRTNTTTVVVSSQEFRKRLGISRQTEWHLRRQKLIPFVRLSARRIGYLESDVDAYLAARRVAA